MKLCRGCGKELEIEMFGTVFSKGKYRVRSRCLSCDNEASKKYQESRREQYRDNAKRYASEHREDRREYLRQWYQENPEKAAQINERRRGKNREYQRRRRASMPPTLLSLERRRNDGARRAREQHAGRVEVVHPQKIMERDNWTCYLCGTEVTLHDFALDHVVPLSKGGDHTEDNLRLTHQVCNLKKGTRTLDRLGSLPCFAPPVLT